MSRKALLLGALCQTATFTALFLLNVSLGLCSVSFVVGGLVTGWATDSIDAQIIHGAGAGALGLFLSFVVFAAVLWFGTASLPFDVRAHYAFITYTHGLFVLIFLIIPAGISGAMTGYLSGVLTGQRRIRTG